MWNTPSRHLVVLKERIEKRMLWWQVPGSEGGSQYCESRWKPEGWAKKCVELAAQRVEIRLRAQVNTKGLKWPDVTSPIVTESMLVSVQFLQTEH